MSDRIFNWPHLMVVTSSSNSCSVDPSQRYTSPEAGLDRADEAELLEGRDTVVQADLLGDFAVLDAKHGRPSEPHFPASRCRQ
jgi:hypothetical protein